MARTKHFAGIDYFRFAAAFLVIAIHTSPFGTWDETIDYLTTYCLGRIAVPFFFMTSGFFLISRYHYYPKKRRDFVKRTAFIYGISILISLAVTLFSLPLILYSGQLPTSVPAFLKDLFFDGTFYHLWYFPAALTGCLLLMLLGHISLTAAAVYSVLAYAAGLLGDSYYGLIKGAPLLSSFYDGIFGFTSYTRNGLFFAPVFILLGALIAVYRIRISKKACEWGLIVSLAGLLLEGYFTYSLDLQKHNSMYLFLLPVLFFLFQFLLGVQGHAPGWIREGSMLLYVIHPAVIVLWRMIAKAAGQTKLLVENTFILYVAVCTLSVTAVYLIQSLKGGMIRWNKKDGHGSN